MRFGCLFAFLLMAAWLGVSYLEVAGTHAKSAELDSEMSKVPGVRQIGSFKSGEIINPVSWFWAPTTQRSYAIPDLASPDLRFYTVSLNTGREEAVWLTSVDCERDTWTTFFPEAIGEGREVALNLLGDPVRDQDGNYYVYANKETEPNPQFLKQYCDTDWSKERRELKAAISKR